MGEFSNVTALLRAPGMSDSDILEVLNPPPSERIRAPLVGDPAMPSHATWRQAPVVGARVDGSSQVVRSNFFKMATAGIPTRIYQYAVHIYAFDGSSHEFKTEDSAGKEDPRILISLLDKFRRNHEDWINRPGFAFTYDGRSLAFANMEFPFTSFNDAREPFHEEILTVTNLDGTESRKRFRVTLTLANVVNLSAAAAANWRESDELTMTSLEVPLLSFTRWGVVEDHPEWFSAFSKVT
jgi:hypothetical protein